MTRLRAWIAARRAERRALGQYRDAWRRLARLRDAPERRGQPPHRFPSAGTARDPDDRRNDTDCRS